MKQKDDGKKTRRQRLAARLSVPESCFSGVPYLEVHGDSTLHLSGYEALLAYEDTCVVFRMQPKADIGCGVLRIFGRKLVLSSLAGGCLSLSGTIDAIVFRDTGYGKEGKT